MTVPMPLNQRPRVPARWLGVALLVGLACPARAPGALRSLAGDLEATARSRTGMVAAGTPEAVAAGIRMLRLGGNAVDAAVATAFALAVTDPANASLGARALVLVAFSDGRLEGIDGTTRAPQRLPPLRPGRHAGAGDPRRTPGIRTAPVPGLPRALVAVLRRHGRLSLPLVLEPAIRLAREGFRVTPRLAAIWKSREDTLRHWPGAPGVFLASGVRAYDTGERFRNPGLARALEALALEGDRVFYEGWIARRIVAWMETSGGLVTAGDLAAYRVQPGIVQRLAYRGHEILTLAGHTWGTTLVPMLNAMSPFDPEATRDPWTGPELVARVIGQALDDRPRDPGTHRSRRGASARRLFELDAFGLHRARRIRGNMEASSGAETTGRPEGGTATDAATGDTTHVSVMDAGGRAVALTLSLGPWFGSGPLCPELGILGAHSYRMEKAPVPGARDGTEMSPTLVRRGGRPVLAVGAAGGLRIPAVIFQVLVNLLDRGLDLPDAVGAPRVFLNRGTLHLHRHHPPGVLAHLRDRGFRLVEVRRGSLQHLGVVHAVQREPDCDVFLGVADPAYDGAAGGPAPVSAGPDLGSAQE